MDMIKELGPVNKTWLDRSPEINSASESSLVNLAPTSIIELLDVTQAKTMAGL